MPRSELRVRRDGPRRDKGCGRRPGQRAWWGGSFASLPFINAIIIRAVKAAAALAVIFGEAFFFFGLCWRTLVIYIRVGAACYVGNVKNAILWVTCRQLKMAATQHRGSDWHFAKTTHLISLARIWGRDQQCFASVNFLFFFGLLRERGRRYDCIRLLFEFKYYSCIFLFYYCRVFCLAETSFSFGL